MNHNLGVHCCKLDFKRIGYVVINLVAPFNFPPISLPICDHNDIDNRLKQNFVKIMIKPSELALSGGIVH